MSVRPLVCVEEFGSSLSQPASRLIAMMAQEVGAVEKQVAGRGTGQCPPASMWPGPACNAQGLSGHKKEKERWCVLEPRIQRVVPLGRAVPARVALFAAFCSQTGTSSGFCVWLLTRGVSRVLHHRFRKARADQPTLASVCLQCSHRVVKTPRGRSRTQTHTQPCS